MDMLPCRGWHFFGCLFLFPQLVIDWKQEFFYMSSIHNPNQNHLLAALHDAEFDRLAPHLELIPMLLGDVLYESGGKLQYVYFPTTSIVSLLYVLENGGVV